MHVVFVGRIHQDETRGAFRVIGSKHTDVESRDGSPDEHHWSSDPGTGEKFGQLARVATRCPR